MMADVFQHEIEVTVPVATDVTERDFVSCLISMYRDCPQLWNVYDSRYSDKNKRFVALQNIVETLRLYKPEYTIEDLKKKINTIRTNYNKERNKVEKSKLTSTSADDVYQPMLWYYRRLLFLSDEVCDSDSEICEQSPPRLLAPRPLPPRQLPPQQNDIQKINRKRPATDTARLQHSKMPDAETDIILNSWAIKINRLAPDQRRYAEKIINDVFFEGEMGTLTRNGVCFLPACLRSPPECDSTPSAQPSCQSNQLHRILSTPVTRPPNQSKMSYVPIYPKPSPK